MLKVFTTPFDCTSRRYCLVHVGNLFCQHRNFHSLNAMRHPIIWVPSCQHKIEMYSYNHYIKDYGVVSFPFLFPREFWRQNLLDLSLVVKMENLGNIRRKQDAIQSSTLSRNSVDLSRSIFNFVSCNLLWTLSANVKHSILFLF